jgi:hypothetical protein
MLDTAAIPILMKAVDFLFEEGRKILEERRERRKNQQEGSKRATESLATQPKTEVNAAEAIQSKEAALKSPVALSAWQNSEADIMHLLSLLEIYARNYHLAKEQYAKWGSALVPPIVVNNLIEAEDAVEATTRELQAVLTRLYTKRFTVQELE